MTPQELVGFLTENSEMAPHPDELQVHPDPLSHAFRCRVYNAEAASVIHFRASDSVHSWDCRMDMAPTRHMTTAAMSMRLTMRTPLIRRIFTRTTTTKALKCYTSSRAATMGTTAAFISLILYNYVMLQPFSRHSCLLRAF